MSDLRWMEQAACVGIDPEIFFAQSGKKMQPVPREVKRVCRNCPVQAECLDYALRHSVHGVWGGTSETQREQLRRDRGIRATPITTLTTCGTPKGIERHCRKGEAACELCVAGEERREWLAIHSLPPLGGRR